MVRLVIKFTIQNIHGCDRTNQYPQSRGPIFRCLQWTYGASVLGILTVSVSLMSKLDVRLGLHVPEAVVQVQRVMTFPERARPQC
jgi:hypothetical protein